MPPRRDPGPLPPLGSAARPIDIRDLVVAEGPVFLAPDSAPICSEIDIEMPHVPAVTLRQVAVKMTAKMLHEPGPQGLPVLEGRAFFDYRSEFVAAPRRKNTKTGAVLMKFGRVGLKSAPSADAGTDVTVRLDESGVLDVSSARDGKDRLDESVAVMLLRATLDCMRRCGFNIALTPEGMTVREVCCVASFPRHVQIESLAQVENVKVEKKSATVLKLMQKNSSMKLSGTGEVIVTAPDYETCRRALQSGLTRIQGCLVFVDPPPTAAKKRVAAPKTAAPAKTKVPKESAEVGLDLGAAAEPPAKRPARPRKPAKTAKEGDEPDGGENSGSTAGTHTALPALAYTGFFSGPAAFGAAALMPNAGAGAGAAADDEAWSVVEENML